MDRIAKRRKFAAAAERRAAQLPGASHAAQAASASTVSDEAAGATTSAAAGAGASSSSSSNSWICTVCTFRNVAGDAVCVMCHSPRCSTTDAELARRLQQEEDVVSGGGGGGSGDADLARRLQQQEDAGGGGGGGAVHINIGVLSGSLSAGVEHAAQPQRFVKPHELYLNLGDATAAAAGRPRAVTLRDVASGPVKDALIPCFDLELDFVDETLPRGCRVTFYAGVDTASGASGTMRVAGAGAARDWRVVGVQMPSAAAGRHAGLMHAKLYLFHSTSPSILRVVISSANCGRHYWGHRQQPPDCANLSWVMDFFPKPRNSASGSVGGVAGAFAMDLAEYVGLLLSAAPEEATRWQRRITVEFDLSTVGPHVHLVGSVPGMHENHDVDRWAIGRLRHLLASSTSGAGGGTTIDGVGARVRARALVAAAALNGSCGIVISADSDRVQVRFDSSGEVKSLKRQNLELENAVVAGGGGAAASASSSGSGGGGGGSSGPFAPSDAVEVQCSSVPKLLQPLERALLIAACGKRWYAANNTLSELRIVAITKARALGERPASVSTSSSSSSGGRSGVATLRDGASSSASRGRPLRGLSFLQFASDNWISAPKPALMRGCESGCKKVHGKGRGTYGNRAHKRGNLHQLLPDCAAVQQYALHSKVLTRRSAAVDGCGWIFSGSQNLSLSAWGSLTSIPTVRRKKAKQAGGGDRASLGAQPLGGADPPPRQRSSDSNSNGWRLKIKHFELGVLITKRTNAQLDRYRLGWCRNAPPFAPRDAPFTTVGRANDLANLRARF